MADPIAQQNSSGFFQSIYDGIFKGDFSSNNSGTKIASQIGVGLVPVAGQVADARDTFAAISDVSNGKSGAWSNLGFSLLGWIPLAGDFAKSVNKVGLNNTLDSIGDAFSSIKRTWGELNQFSDKRLGSFDGLFYKPSTNMNNPNLDYGTLGETNRWGDISVSKFLDKYEKQTTFDHENVHRFFSPMFKYGQEFRANLRFLGYNESHLLRRVEEGLAEVWSRYKADGFSGLKEAWRFPLENPYDIDLNRLKIERNILIGVGSSAIGTGAAIGDSIKSNE